MNELRFQATGLGEDRGRKRRRNGHRPERARFQGWVLIGIALLFLLSLSNLTGSVEIISPASGTTTLEAQFPVSGRAANIDDGTVTLSVNGSAQTVAASGGSFDAQVSLALGENIIIASAEGYSSQPITIIRRLRPVVTISSPGDTTIQDRIEVNGTVENGGDGAVSIDVNGATQTVAVMGNRFTTTVLLEVGRNEIRATVPEASPATVVVSRLETGIAITSPSDGYTTDQPTVAVTGTVENPSAAAITLKLNESRQTIPVHNGIFASDVSLRIGENRIQASAGAALSNEIAVHRTLPPVIITLTSPQSGDTQNPAVSVRGTIQNPRGNKVTIIVNGKSREVPVTAGSFAAEVGLAIGKNVIRAAQGEAVSPEVQVTRVQPRVVIQIVSPQSGSTQDSTARVTGTVTNPRGPTVTLTHNGNTRTLPITNDGFASIVKLEIGENRIRAAQGEAVSPEVQVTRVQPRVVIQIVSPQSGSTQDSTARVTGTITNPRGPTVTLTHNGSARTLPITNDGFASIVKLEIGENRIRAAQGEAVSNEVQVTRVQPRVVIQIVSPQSGSTQDSTARVTGTITNPQGPTVTLTHNGSARTLPITNDSFAADVALEVGENRIRASQRDASDEVVVKRVRPAVLIQIRTPKSGSTRNPSARVMGTITNPRGPAVTLTHNGSTRTLPITNDSFAAEVDLEIGENRIQASQAEAVSNEVRLRRLASRPSIRIISPQSGLTTDSAVKVSGKVENATGNTIRLTVNGASRDVPIIDGSFAEGVKLIPGENLIVASIEGASDQITLVRPSVTRKGRIVIDTPKDGQITDQSAQVVIGRVENIETEEITLSINGKARQVQAPLGAFRSRVALRAGKNSIQASHGEVSDEVTVMLQVKEPDKPPDKPPDEPAADCSKIDCDCKNVGPTLSLTGTASAGYVAGGQPSPFSASSTGRQSQRPAKDLESQCREAEYDLKKRCKATGKVEGVCPPNASGRNAWPTQSKKKRVASAINKVFGKKKQGVKEP